MARGLSCSVARNESVTFGIVTVMHYNYTVIIIPLYVEWSVLLHQTEIPFPRQLKMPHNILYRNFCTRNQTHASQCMQLRPEVAALLTEVQQLERERDRRLGAGLLITFRSGDTRIIPYNRPPLTKTQWLSASLALGPLF